MGNLSPVKLWNMYATSLFITIVLCNIYITNLAQAMPSNFENLTPCERAIWSCCSTSSQQKLISNCFERNQCPGLQFEGKSACDKETLLGIGTKLGLNNNDQSKTKNLQ